MSNSDDPKPVLRAELRHKRDAIHDWLPDAGERLAGRFPGALKAPTQPGAVVAGYVPIGSEIDPRPLMRELEALGWRTAFPRTPPRQTPGTLAFHACPIDGPFQPSPWRVPQPGPDTPTVRPDLILVPLLGFDRDGGRIGQGQGHYDRCLQALRAQAPVVAVGLAFSVQEVTALPLEPHDQPLDWIVTEKAAYRASGT
jgi:5-formyltetrahydrofolate cyclo-ligase